MCIDVVGREPNCIGLADVSDDIPLGEHGSSLLQRTPVRISRHRFASGQSEGPAGAGPSMILPWWRPTPCGTLAGVILSCTASTFKPLPGSHRVLLVRTNSRADEYSEVKAGYFITTLAFESSFIFRRSS